jgi:hypothetical protein
MNRNSSSHPRPVRWVIAVAAALSLCGCIGEPSNPGMERRATAIDPAEATDTYWYARPAVAHVDAWDYDRLWAACAEASHDRLFDLDRLDYREGLMTTQPMISQQFFEPWRADCLTFADLMQSSIQQIRRTIRFEFSRKPDGPWQMTPKVLIERRANREDRVTSVVQYRAAVGGSEITNTALIQSQVARGKDIPYQYWYAIGRDADLERAVADDVQKAVSQPLADSR